MTAPDLAPMAPIYTPPPRQRRWGILIAVAVVVAVLGVIVGGVFALRAIILSISANSAYGEPLVVGEHNYPYAPVLLECDVCFDEDDIAATVLDEATLDAFGFTQHDFPYGTYDPTTADELFRSITATWAAQKGGPIPCVFAIGSAPAVVNLVTDEGREDLIVYTGEHATSDITSTISQSVRVFPTQADAMTLTSHLYYQVEGCTEISFGNEPERFTAQVSPAPAIDLPDDIEMMGWVRTGDPGPRWRAYTFDLRRGNLVVRTRMLTDGSVREQDFRAFVEEYALQLEAIEPDLLAP